MGSRRCRALLVALVLAALQSCAPPSERRARDTLRQIEQGAFAPALRGGAARPDLPKLAESSTLDDYLKYAALNNPGLRAAFERWRAALERVPQVTALPEPKLTFGYFIRRVETRVGPQRFRLGLSQMFPWFGKRDLRGSVALAEAQAAYEQLEAARLKLGYRVQDAYYELYYLARALAITKENVELLKYIESVARARYRVRRAEYADVIRAEVELGKHQDQYHTLDDMKAPMAARLNAALNRAPDAPVPLPKTIPHDTLEADPKEILAWMRATNPELKALEAEIARQQAAVRLAKKNYYPDLTLGLSYIETGSARMPTSDSGQDAVIAEVGGTLPIWRRKYRAAEREAAARLRSARESVSERHNALAAQVKLTLFKLRDAERKLHLYRDTLVPKAQASLKATQAAYRAGKATLTDLIDSERVLLAFRLEQERALANRAQRLAELEMLVGRKIVSRKEEKPVEHKEPKGESRKKDP